MTRQELERRVLRKVAGNVFAAGYSIKVTCEGDEVSDIDFHTSANKAFISDATCADMIHLEVYSENEHYTTILLVFGNDGYDLVADHGTRATIFMPTDEEMDRYERYAMNLT